MPLPHPDRLDREHRIRVLLSDGLTTREIAEEVGTSQQSVNKFLNRRGWKTAASISHEDLCAEIARYMGQGMGVHSIAERVGRTEKFILNTRPTP